MIKKMFATLLALGISLVALAASEDKNVTKSPDGTMEAFTRGGDLWVRACDTGRETRLTTDGSETILNGYASWVYYEEIFGRASNYKAFWWSPDSRRIAFYRFDNSRVPQFPIYCADGQTGKLIVTRYPKAGQRNPEVRVGFFDLDPDEGTTPVLTWANFESGDQYFGTPFWGPDGRRFFVQREPRLQNQLGLYMVDSESGIKKLIYTEKYATWLDFMDGMFFTYSGIYLVRSFETGWEQIYYLSYNGKEFRRLTDGPNWDVRIIKVDDEKGDVWFTARRDSPVHPGVYRVDSKGTVTSLTEPGYWVANVKESSTGAAFTADISTSSMPWKSVVFDAYNGYHSWLKVVEDKGAGMDLSDTPKPEIVKIENDGFDLYGLISYPRGFDPNRKYPVKMCLYGGPGTPYVRDYWGSRDASDRWCYENGVIYIVVDPRSSGENGRRGLDQAYCQMTVIELEDYKAWARYLQSLPFVRADRIGVTGFSFGGTTTAMLVLRYPELFHCGIAGGGVYDWTTYDSVYTERYMQTPELNPEGYAKASVLTFLKDGSIKEGTKVNLRLTHGTGDDNVHFQNTLQLVEALQDAGIDFELMIYPDGMHGYRGAQRKFDAAQEDAFWRRNLLD